MGKVCSIKPKNSKLFDKIDNYFKEAGVPDAERRRLVVQTWETAVNPAFHEVYDIDNFYDKAEGFEFDEPVIEDVIDKMGLEEIVQKEMPALKLQRELGILNKDNTPKTFQNYYTAVDAAIQFNDKSKSHVASLEKVKDGYEVRVETVTSLNRGTPERVVFNDTLNKKLLDLLRAAGFDAEFDDCVKSGIFDPKNARRSADGLITVIRISKGESGEMVFPEEYGHWLIDITSQKPLTERLMNLLDEDTVKAVIGEEQYDAYMQEYGSKELVAKEVAGQLVEKYIRDADIPMSERLGFVVSRFCNWLKSLFGKIKTSDINKAIADANAIAYRLAKLGQRKSFVTSTAISAQLSDDRLLNLRNEGDKLMKIAKDAMELHERKMRISLRKNVHSGKYAKTDMETLSNMRANFESGKYLYTCLSFLANSLDELTQLSDELKEEFKLRKAFGTAEKSDLTNIKSMSIKLLKMLDFYRAYAPIVGRMQEMKALRDIGEVDMSDEDLEMLTGYTDKFMNVLNGVKGMTTGLQFDTIVDMLSMYCGEDLLKKVNEGDPESLTIIEELLKRGESIGFFDSTTHSLARCSDTILHLVDKIAKTQRIKRDVALSYIKNAVTAEVKTMRSKGYNVDDLMYEKDENGKPTGRYKSDIDFAKYEAAKQSEIDRINEKYPDKNMFFKMNLLEQWVKNNTEPVPVINKDIYGRPVQIDTERAERLPKMSLYGKPEAQRLEKVMSADEYKFYNKMMFLKRQMDSLLPAAQTHMYLAPQVHNETLEAISKKDKKATAVMDAIKNKFIRRSDMGERGYMPFEDVIDEAGNVFSENPNERKTKYVNTNLAGTAEQQYLPVYMTNPVEDIDTLSTDFTSAFLAYAGMSLNFSTMNEVIDILELTKDYIKNEREYLQTAGSSKLGEHYNVMSGKTDKDLYVKGASGKTGDRLDAYFRMVPYGKMKKDEGTVRFVGKDWDIANVGDFLKFYSSAIGLGLNVPAAITNVLMGKIQMFIESTGGEFMNVKDMAAASKEYMKEIWNYLGELNAVQKKSKLSLLIDRYDLLDEFFNNAKYDKYYSSDMKRIMGKASWFILNHAGEHLLHCQTGIAMLKHIKVRIKENESDAWKETTLYDAYRVKETKDGDVKSYDLVLPQFVETIKEDSEGNKTYTKFDYNSFVDTRLKISSRQHALHGAFNEEDLGAMSEKVVGRLVMNFRQWMPEYYQNRFQSRKTDVIVGHDIEGFYRTYGRFMADLIKDVRRGQFQYKTRYAALNDWEKANIRKARTELAIFAGLMILTRLFYAGLKDKKGYWTARQLAYQMKRLGLEVGAGIPLPTAIWNSAYTIFKSPAAAVNTTDGLIDLLKVWEIADKIEQGQYKGMSKWHRNLYRNILGYGQIRRTIDMATEEYPFNLYKND